MKKSVLSVLALVFLIVSLSCSALSKSIPPTVAPTQIPLPTDTPQPPGKTILGSWERHTAENTEQLTFNEDGSYTVEARQNDTNEIIASSGGTFTYDENTIHYVDKDNNEFTESYYLSQDGDLLVINNVTDRPWERIR